VRTILGEVPDLTFIDLTGTDVVRHRLVQRIVSAYEAYEEAREASDDG
jgi:phosphate starvation-inducible PhoH-like protein